MTLAQSKERKGSNLAIWQPCYPATLPVTYRLEIVEKPLTVVQWIDGVYHELEQSVPEVAAGVQDGNVGGPPPRVLARHHARHGRPRHARLERGRRMAHDNNSELAFVQICQKS